MEGTVVYPSAFADSFLASSSTPTIDILCYCIAVLDIIIYACG